MPSNGPEGLCWAHDPKNQEKRRRGQSRGGKNKPSKELLNVKEQLQDLTNGVLEGDLDRADASVCGQLLNIKLRALEIERRLKETEELAERIEELEASLAAGGTVEKGGRRWG